MNAKWILITALASGIGGCRYSSCQEKQEKGEAMLSIEQVPPAPRKTLMREAGAGKFVAIERKTVFEADVMREGNKWEIVVDDEGDVVSKKHDTEAAGMAEMRSEPGDEWRQSFSVTKSNLAPTGSNRWMPIKPGQVLKLRSADSNLTVSILRETEMVDGVQCGVLEEREEAHGNLIEVSRNFFATDPRSGDVYYFGEDVDNYKDGKIINHESAWRSGMKGAKFGLMVPGVPRKGDKFYQEMAPGVAMDRVEIVSVDETLRTPAGEIKHCVHLRETTPLDKDVSHKWYAPGVGIVKDDEFELAEMPG